MGPEPGQGSGTGGTPGPVRGPGQPGPGTHSNESAADPESADQGAPSAPPFALGGAWDGCAPSAALAAAAEAASGPGWQCADRSRDELIGLARQWQAVESWAAAGKLGVLRALIREEDQPLPGGGYSGDLPEGWTKSLTYEVAAALAMSAVSAENLMWLAWDLHARLPGTGALLAAGGLTLAKARAVDQALAPLTGQDAAAAEEMILPQLAGKTYSQVAALAAQAAITVDPESAVRRRQDAEQNKSRVQLFREESGAAGLSGRDLPADQTLAAHTRVCERAAQYKDSGVFGEARVDRLRAAAYLDLINGITAETRIASGQLAAGSRVGQPADDLAGAEPGPDAAAEPGPDATAQPEPDGAPQPGSDAAARADDNAAQRAEPRTDAAPGPTSDSPTGGSPGQPGPASPPRPRDLVLPLATLLGLGERPGEGHGLGPLDPDLCRELADAAIASPWTRLCVTVTDGDGIAIGHGCARRVRQARRQGNAGSRSDQAGVPARAQLTVTAGQLTDLADATGPPGSPAWALTRNDDPGPPGGFGTWTLALPDGRRLAVAIEPVPTLDCDHRHETHAYQPGDLLRHLVQVRDGECTFPTCSRHATESDFEHAMPFDKGGRTCGCNAGARSRQCHRVKQSPGWTLTQPKPGWHEWTTPAGRTYTQGPKQYPV